MLSTKFQPKKLAVKKSDAEYRLWQALFHTTRFLFWEDSKGRIFKDALDRGIITPIAPGVRQPDGTWGRDEFDSADIAQLYKEAWDEFKDEFDAEFIRKKPDELVTIAKEYFGYDRQMLLELNDKRQAANFGR